MLLLLGCTSDCPTGTTPKDGACVGDDDDAAETDADTGDTGESGPPDTADTGEPEAPCAVLSVSEAPLGEVVNNRRVHVSLDSPGVVTATCALLTGGGERTSLLGGGPWRYWDEATVAAGWADPTFDDAGWPEGDAPLGYGEHVATTIAFGEEDDKHVAAWFRQRFELDAPPDGARLDLTYDDGALVYLNGALVASFNLPADAEVDTLTKESVEPTLASVDLPATAFVVGENVLAVELHQSAPTTSDAWMDADVTAVTAVGEPDPDEVLVVTAARGTEVDVDVHGLLADSTYACEVAPSCGDAASVQLTTGPLPSAVPSMLAEGAPPTPGYVVFSLNRPCEGEVQLYAVLVDHEGQVRWYDALDDVVGSQATDIEVARVNGDQFLWGGGDDPDAVPQIVDLAGETVYRAGYTGVDRDQYHHDVEQTAEGTLAGLVQHSTQLASGPRVTGFGIVEHDPATSEVVWTWTSQDGVDAGELPAGTGADPWHANALASTTDSQGSAAYVNLYATGHVVRVDKARSALTHVLGRGGDLALYDAAGDPVGDEGWWSQAHGLGVDGDLLTIWDNGTDTGVGRALLYRIDLDRGEAFLLESWTEGWYSPVWGDVDALPDGTWLADQPGAACFGGTAAPGSIVRVDPVADDVLLRLTFPSINHASYRAEWIDGCALFGNRKFCP